MVEDKGKKIRSSTGDLDSGKARGAGCIGSKWTRPKTVGSLKRTIVGLICIEGIEWPKAGGDRISRSRCQQIISKRKSEH